MKKSLVVSVLAVVVVGVFYFSLFAFAETKKARVTLPDDKNLPAFAERNNVSIDDLIKWNPQLKEQRKCGNNIEVRPYQLCEGEELYVENPQNQEIIEEKIPDNFENEKNFRNPPENRESLWFYTGFGEGERTDYIFSGLYLDLPLKSWFSLIFSFNYFSTTDRDFLAEQGTFRYMGGLALRSSRFISETKIGQDYSSGFKRGVNLEENLQFGFWRIWNDLIIFFHSKDWPFWTRERLKLNIYQGLSFGGEIKAFGWKDPGYPGEYFYIVEGGPFLRIELNRVQFVLGADFAREEKNTLITPFGELLMKLF